MKNTVFPHKFWRPFLDCTPQLFFRPQYVWFPVHLKGHLIPLCYETLVVSWQNWLFTLFHQSRSVLSPNPIPELELELMPIPILPPRTPHNIAHWQVAPPARPPSRWTSDMILTGACCSFPDFLNMEWYNKAKFQYDIYNTTIHAQEPVLSKIKHQIIL